MKKTIQSAFLAFVFLTVFLNGCAPAPTPTTPPTPKSGIHIPIKSRDWLITVNSVVQSNEVKSFGSEFHPKTNTNTFVIVEFTALNLQSNAPTEFPEEVSHLNGVYFFNTSGAFPSNAFSLKDAVLRSDDGVYPIAGIGVGGVGTVGTPIIVFATNFSEIAVASHNSVEIYFFAFDVPNDVANQLLTFQFQELTTAPFLASEKP